MTQRTRYFFSAAAVLLVAGIGVGLVAYYRTSRQGVIPAGLPDELRFVPATAELVAYADVKTVMNSELRRELERSTMGPRRGRSDMHEFAGIDVEKQVDHIVAYLEKIEGGAAGAESAKPAQPVQPAQPAEPRREGPPRGLLIAQGTFEQAKVEQFLTEHGGAIDEYHGKHMAIRRPGPENKDNKERPAQERRAPEEMAIGFLQPNLIALGHADLVRAAIDLSANASPAANVTSNTEVMNLVRDAAGDTAWVVGHFDAVSRRIGVPSAMRQQVPPLRMVAAKARINGGVKATIRAETADQAAADQLRDVIRGFVSLIRLQGGAKPELQDTLKSIELGGRGNTVQLSFAMSAETFRAVVPQPMRNPRPDRALEPPVPPVAPQAPPSRTVPPAAPAPPQR
jgi:hypothetical protein